MGSIRYAHPDGVACDSYGVERYADLPVGPIDWPFVNAEIGLP